MRFFGALPLILAIINGGLAVAVNWRRLTGKETVEESRRRRRLRTFVKIVWWILGITALIIAAIFVISAFIDLLF